MFSRPDSMVYFNRLFILREEKGCRQRHSARKGKRPARRVPCTGTFLKAFLECFLSQRAIGGSLRSMMLESECFGMPAKKTCARLIQWRCFFRIRNSGASFGRRLKRKVASGMHL